MSDPSLETTREAKEEQGPSPSEEDTGAKSSVDENSQASSTKDEQTNEKSKKDGTPNRKRRRENSPSDLSIKGNKKPRDNTEVVAEHYNTLEQQDTSYRNQSRIVYMRNFNNWMKTMLINEYVSKIKQDKIYGSSFTVLDMCCGKGGDLFKWQKANITHLICADIAQISLEQCEHRYNDMLSRSSNERGFDPIFKVEFITADCTKVRLREKYKDPSTQVDLVSCQFAFHYCFESLPQAECMLRNASESLKAGGYFIGTVPDAYEIASRWQKSEGNKFGNDVYSVELYSENKEDMPLFGAKYNFHLEGVVDCPEFLVHLPTLSKLALKFGLKLVMFERFEKYYERMKGEGRSLLGKMQALETYPPYHGTPLLGNPTQDYQHAIQYMQNLPDHRKIGTLSQPEWEATTLYAVFAFQKMKTTWNNDGKAEYVTS